MANTDIGLADATQAINALTGLIDKLNEFKYAVDIIYIIMGIVVGCFIYILVKMVLEHLKGSKTEKLVADCNNIMGQCTEVMRAVYTALNNREK